MKDEYWKRHVVVELLKPF